jgi:hypothetical protein
VRNAIREIRRLLNDAGFRAVFWQVAPGHGGVSGEASADRGRLGAIPAPVGHEGSVRELVPIAHRFGFYWGGYFKQRPDGMHFEVAIVKD